MGRKYLTLEEAMSALNRGKEVESFIGGFENKNEIYIRWVSLSKINESIIGKVWESLDEGSEDYLDVYSFSPLNGEWNEPVKTVTAQNIEQVLAELEVLPTKLINTGMVQDEYASYKAQYT